MNDPVSAAARLATSDYVVMVIYLAFVVGLGVLFSRRESNTDEYLLGGRRMPWWVIGISYMVSLLSTISLVAVPGEAYKNGITLAVGNVLAPFAAIGTFYLFVRFYFRVKMYTPFSYLEQRFDHRVRLLGSLVFWWTRLVYLGLVLYSSSKVFKGAAGWPLWWTICLVGVVGTVYTTLGGMKAVVWTDFAQFIVLGVGLAVVALKCAASVEGGVVGIVKYAFAHGRGLEHFGRPEFYTFSPYVRLTFWLLLIGIFMEYLFYNSSDQISIQRLLSTSSYKQAEKSVWMFALLGVPFSFVLWFLGLAVFAVFMALAIASVSESIEETILEAGTVWGSIAGVLAPMFLIAVTTRKVKANHIIAACVSAWVVNAGMVVWYLASKGGAHPISFKFVGFPGLVVMLVMGYLPVFLPGEPDPAKTEGLTLWTLRPKADGAER